MDAAPAPALDAAPAPAPAPDAAAPTEEFTVDENTVAMAPFDKDGVECDTKDAEDLDVTQTLLGLWGGRLPGLEERVTTFACAVDSALLAAWVKQPSPCCAAAGVGRRDERAPFARVGRRDARAMQPLEILATMRGLLRDTVAKKRASFERKLGATSPAARRRRGQRRARGKRFGASTKKEAAASVTAKYLLGAVRAEADAADANEPPAPVFCRLWELYEEDAARKRAEAEKRRLEAGGVRAVADDDDDRDDDDDDDDDDGEPPEDDEAAPEAAAPPAPAVAPAARAAGPPARAAAAPAPGGPRRRRARAPSRKKSHLGAARRAAKPWAWKADLGDILKKCDGIAKTRPSTAAFGNWGLIHAAEQLARDQLFDDVWAGDDASTAAGEPRVDEPAAPAAGAADAVAFLRLDPEPLWACPKAPVATVRVTLFAGAAKRGSAMACPLRRGDGGPEVEAQWGKLHAVFLDPRACLLFHLKNHYALIYALRDWVDTSDPAKPRRVRQMLTARKGQRPSAWIDWLEARETMLNWAGYKMMVVRDAR
ncbi:hypothetical protein SO694_00020051 [Aureococcus anophagefferens]|uniref:Uncharacterized protein n=1 Tax=Aureococcus anophagefferens TaxID=44056 RepID=A0ABR1FTR1_AURAN